MHGAKEFCASDDGAHNYRVLVKNSDFRKVLSNFYAPEKPIEYKGHLFATLVCMLLGLLLGCDAITQEHMWHYNKFERMHPEFALLFTLDASKDKLFATNPAFAKSVGGKGGKIQVNADAPAKTVEREEKAEKKARGGTRKKKGQKQTIYERPSSIKMDPLWEANKSVLTREMQLAKYTQVMNSA